jgi:hypothetical protein
MLGFVSATNEPTWDMYIDQVTTDLLVHTSRLVRYEPSTAFAPLDILALAGTTRVVSVLHFPGHWTIFSIDPVSGHVTFVDSMPYGPRRAFASSALLQFARLLEVTLGLSIGEWTFERLAPSHQYNGEDCGFFAIANAIKLLRGLAPERVRFNRVSSERYATRYRWSMLRMFHTRLGGTSPVQHSQCQCLETSSTTRCLVLRYL